jgi:hypothetical protein
MPKAMVFVLANGTISRCYNGMTGATTNGCGFSATVPGTGLYRINFGFDTSQKFLSLSTFGNSFNISGRIDINSGGTVGVYTFDTSSNAVIPSDFFLIVY